ncbi:MAG: HAD family hydrolase [Flaviflexus sp.]|nr:HAD family hydrolase [Flaviflexus sp.]
MRACLIDFHDTLVYSEDAQVWVERAEAACGVRAQAGLADLVQGAYGRAETLFPDIERDLDPVSHRLALTRTLVSEGTDERLADALYDTMPSTWQAFTDSRDFLTSLGKLGVRRCLMSNVGMDLRPRLADLGLIDLLDDIVLSCEIGAVKPNREAFAAGLHACGTEPQHTVMIGDSPRHDSAAANLGITTVILGPPTGTTRGLMSLLGLFAP